MDDKPVVFHDLTPDSFPFILQILDDETLETLWQTSVEGPGAIEVPGFAPRVVRSRLWTKDGWVAETTPDGVTRHFDLSDELKEAGK